MICRFVVLCVATHCNHICINDIHEQHKKGRIDNRAMAKEAVIEMLEEDLNCSICLDSYTNPKLLQCFHTYCQQCLVQLVDKDQQGQFGLTCPACRQVTPIPQGRVKDLRPAFHINHLLKIQEKYSRRSRRSKGNTSSRDCR